MWGGNWRADEMTRCGRERGSTAGGGPGSTVARIRGICHAPAMAETESHVRDGSAWRKAHEETRRQAPCVGPIRKRRPR